MTIDVLSDPGSAPIIVGDADDMPDLQAIGDDPGGRVHLVLKGHKVDLSEPASENFRSARHVLLVSVAGQEVTQARKVRIDNLDDGHELSDDQRRALAEALSLDSEREFRTAKLEAFRRANPEVVVA